MIFNDLRPQVGVGLPRVDALTKVTGQEKFAADYFAADFLWVGVKRAEIPHARLLGIDIEGARQVPGVIAVLTHHDVPSPNRYGIVRKDQPVLVDDRVRRCGDPLALVLAENRQALDRALAAIQVDLEPLEAVFDPVEALKPGAPLVHEDHPDGNLLAQVSIKTGEGAEALKGCEVVIEGRFETPRQAHVCLETEAGWAYLDEAGCLTVIASTQSPFRDRTEIAQALGLDMGRVRVISPYLGGGFGSKDGVTVQLFLALAALRAGGRPVKMHWDRRENLLAGVKRLPACLTYRLGAKTDGTLLALDAQIYMDGGPYDHLCAEVLALAVEHAGGAYRIPNVRLEGWCAYTNNPASGPFRGFGAPQVTAAMEQMMDLLADRIDRDPLDLRRQNILRPGDKNPIGVTLTQTTGIEACLNRLSEHPLWTERSRWKSEAETFKRRGVGIAALMHGAGYGPIVPDYANAKIELTADGLFRVDAGVSDMGQGNAATCLQIAGDILNQSAGRITLVLPDTDQTLPSCSSAASRTTYTYANALILAAKDMKQRILSRAADLIMAKSTEELALVPDLVRHRLTGREIPLSSLARMMAPSERVATGHWRAPVAQEKLNAEIKGVYGLPHIIFSYGAHLAAIEVDELTGQVEVCHYLAVTEAGRVINPQVYHQQIQGSIVQGLGYALCEDYVVSEGRGLTPDLATYVVPLAPDSPEIESLAVELHEPTGPFGMKGVGEISINGPLPAVANAVANAVGVRTFRAPLTPERINATVIFQKATQ